MPEITKFQRPRRFFGPESSLEAQIQPSANVLSRKARTCAGSRRSFVIFSTFELEERIDLPQVTAAQELQIKAQKRLSALTEEKLVTRISVLSTLLGGGKTTERLVVRISIETHKTSPDFDQTAADKTRKELSRR